MPKTVLIIEDYVDIRAMMKFLVEGFGYQVVEAADGKEAIERVKQSHPDLISEAFDQKLQSLREYPRNLQQSKLFSA